jgi:hypothetical protein
MLRSSGHASLAIIDAISSPASGAQVKPRDPSARQA